MRCEMKKVILSFVFCYPLTIFSTGLEPIALASISTVAQYCCVPAIKWCSGAIHDSLETQEEKENREWLKSLTAKNLEDLKIDLESCKINIFENIDQQPSLLVDLFTGGRGGFKRELGYLIHGNIALRDFQLGPTIHALAFHDESNILPIWGWVKNPSHQDFDFLFGDKKLSQDQEEEKIALEKIVSKLNKILSRSEEADEGLFLSPSGRKFYKFGPTYLLPLSTDEMITDMKVIHETLDFQGATQIIEHSDLSQADLSQLDIDIVANRNSLMAGGGVKKKSCMRGVKKTFFSLIRGCCGCIHDSLETDVEKLSRIHLNSVIQSPLLQESMIEFKMKNCNIHVFDNTQNTLIFNQKTTDGLAPFQQELQMLADRKLRIVDLELGEQIHMLVFHDEMGVLPIGGVIKKPSAHNFDSLFKIDPISVQKRSQRHGFLKVISVLNRLLENSYDPHEGLYVSVAGRSFYKFGSTYFLPLRKDEIGQNHLVDEMLGFEQTTSHTSSASQENQEILMK